MTDNVIMMTDAEGVKDYRQIRAQHRRQTGQSIGTEIAPKPSMHVAEVITVPEAADDFTEFAARLVKQNGTDWDQIRDVETVRLAGGRPVAMKVSGKLLLLSTSLHLDVQLTEDLDAATDFATSPATATANVLTRKSSGNLEKLQYNGSDVQITITNRNEAWDTVPAETFGGAVLKNDEWRPDDFDCDAAAGGLI